MSGLIDFSTRADDGLGHPRLLRPLTHSDPQTILTSRVWCPNF
ncbi:hypothetical protein CURTO8I2_320085 [Curtobacterium sp. 8I-2]|nr:hypothetical protein CURTO8I2_320085 [Curtobacterium sp. 8I-2]